MVEVLGKTMRAQSLPPIDGEGGEGGSPSALDGPAAATRSVPAVLVTLLVAAVYFCGGKLGLSLAFVNASATGVWPPTGISLARWGDFPWIWLTWWLGDAVSAVVVAPLIIVWAGARPRLTGARLLEAFCLFVMLVLVSQAVFGGWPRLSIREEPLEYLGIPLLLWAALRFGQHGAVAAVAVMSSIAILATWRGSGPFAVGEPNKSLLLLQSFMGTITVTAMILAAVVSERRRVEDSLRAARNAAERASRMKDEFLATLSHELRTPLTPVMLTVSRMELRHDLSQELRDDVAAIRQNVELESQLIGDLLDLTRIARGRLKLEFTEVDLHAVIRSAIDICQREAAAKLVVELDAKRHTVRADATRLQQVFWNLIGNAQKFTPPGGTITIRSSDAPAGHVRVDVSDTGIGIDSASLPRLFDAFEQGEARGTSRQAGLGLGLAISRMLVDAHGGTIAAQSRGRGQGATFIVDLPSIEKPAHLPAIASDAAPIGAAPLRVLVVEDHEPTLRAMTKLLDTLGHRVTGVASVASALASAKQDHFDLLLSDLGLPDGSGLDLMRQLLPQYAGKSIALTGYGMEQDIRDSRDGGFSAHLIKPVDLRQLEQAILELGAGVGCKARRCQ